MGIVVVLLFYFVVLMVLATISSGVLILIAWRYLRTVPVNRKKAIPVVALFPFACVFFVGAWFVGYAVINDQVFHHDPMLGDGWYTNIGNGYAIDMIDVTDHGIVHPTDGSLDHGLNSPSGVDGVRRLQIVGTQIFGTRDGKIFENFGSGKQAEDTFFVIDTRSRVRKDFPSEAALIAAARNDGINLKLEPIADVYQHYRTGWFDWTSALFLFVVPAYALWRLAKYVKRQRDEGLTMQVVGSPASS